jgi:hypothetical protein
MVGLTISAGKSKAMVFSRKHHKLDVTLLIDGRRLPQTKNFKYQGYAGVHKCGTCKYDNNNNVNNACKD